MFDGNGVMAGPSGSGAALACETVAARELETINVFQPSLGNEELAAIADVFAASWPGRGRLTDEFEARFAEHLGAPRDRVTNVSCCTEGLFQAVRLLATAPGQEVVMPAIGFVGMANAAAGQGHKPVFCDIDPRTLNPTAATIEPHLTDRTAAVMLLHYGGVPCEMREIVDMLSDRDVPLIEDSACSVASRYRGQACGTFGAVGAWSFDAMKILVTGDGGMVHCTEPELGVRMREALYLGLKTSSGLESGSRSRWWEFDVGEPGRRAVMNDVASAMGVEQLRKMPSFIARRRAVHAAYDAGLRGIDGLETPPPIPGHVESSHYFYWIRCEPRRRDELAVHLRDRGIYSTFRYWPLHRVSTYGSNATLPYSDAAAEQTLCLPMHHSLSDSDVDRVIDAVETFSKAAG